MKILLSVIAVLTTTSAIAAPSYESTMKAIRRAQAAESCHEKYEANIKANQEAAANFVILSLNKENIDAAKEAANAVIADAAASAEDKAKATALLKEADTALAQIEAKAKEINSDLELLNAGFDSECVKD